MAIDGLRRSVSTTKNTGEKPSSSASLIPVQLVLIYYKARWQQAKQS